MSETLAQNQVEQTNLQINDLVKPTQPLDVKGQVNGQTQHQQHHQQQQQPQSQEKNQHPLHQYDLTLMKRFYESCVGKFQEKNPQFQPVDWANLNPIPSNLTQEQRSEWSNPWVVSQKQRVYEAFAKLARESGEPMVLMPSFDYGDISNFERFLQAMKQDGINAIGKYKQYLNNKDMRKFEVDLVVVHPRYGVLLFEVKDCDTLDNKRRSKAKAQLNNARSCFESMGRLIAEANGWTHGEAHIQVTEFIALPNVHERPFQTSNNQNLNNSLLQTPGGNHNHSASSVSSTGRHSRQLNYLIRPDLENSVEFSKWWTKWVVEPKVQQQQQAEVDNKVNKFDLNATNCLIGLINCIRNNSIMPVVYPEVAGFDVPLVNNDEPQQNGEQTENKTNDEQTQQQEGTEQQSLPPQQQQQQVQNGRETQFQPALNVHGEFFQAEHEQVRSLTKVAVLSTDSEKLRKTVCLQIMWFLLNDSQKKVSVVCSEMNKPYYEEFFARQRKLYNNLNNVRFFHNLDSCNVEGQHTLRKDGEIWFFDNGINGQLSKIVECVRELNAYWLFTTQEETLKEYIKELEGTTTRYVYLDNKTQTTTTNEVSNMPWLTGNSLKFPLRLQCDLLIIGDLIGLNQLKPLYRYLKSNSVTNHASHYQNNNQNGHHNQYHYNHHYQQQQQQLSFNPAKKFRTVKFIRGGSIENLRNSLKMHDSIQAQVVLMHVGDEDLFKVRNTANTVERVKELATLVKEYCPKSFVVLSTLMRRMSRTENGASNEVNKGIVNFCKQTRDTTNCYYMLNNHFEPDYHTQEGRTLNNKGLRLYVDNLLFMVDYFLMRNNKQH